jgi:4a-hydroxytetrahydrobiopterin dehydratase
MNGEARKMRMSDEEMEQKLQVLHGWTLETNIQIMRKYHFREFMTGIRFVNEVARIAQELNHHPSIQVQFTEIILRLTTHDEEGLTELDFISAEHYDTAFESLLHE